MTIGIDYGRLTGSNRDAETGIRFGVIPAHDVGDFWYEDSEADYGISTCPECGGGVKPSPDDKDWLCPRCGQTYRDEDVYPEQPLAFTYNRDGYELYQDGDDTDIFVIKSPYFTYAALCSPCAPGAAYLTSTVDTDPDNRAYCLGHEWFESGVAPYPVYLVETGGLVTGGE